MRDREARESVRGGRCGASRRHTRKPWLRIRCRPTAASSWSTARSPRRWPPRWRRSSSKSCSRRVRGRRARSARGSRGSASWSTRISARPRAERDYRRHRGPPRPGSRSRDRRSSSQVVCGDVSDAQWDDLLFAWRVVKHVTSNAIVLAHRGQTLGIGAGQMSRVDAVRIAIQKAHDLGHTWTNVLASTRSSVLGRAEACARSWDRRSSSPVARSATTRSIATLSGRRRDGLHRPASLQALMDAVDLDVRRHVYCSVVANGRPRQGEASAALGMSRTRSRPRIGVSTTRMRSCCTGTNDVWMANPFCFAPTSIAFDPVAARGPGLYCWDALGIPGALHADGEVATECACCGDASNSSRAGELVEGADLLCHVLVPARRWWDDIGFVEVTVFLRSEEHLERWLAANDWKPGATVPAPQMNELARVVVVAARSGLDTPFGGISGAARRGRARRRPGLALKARSRLRDRWRAARFPTVLELVGNTPIVRLARLGRDVPGELLAKLEYLNPGGSVKTASARDGRGGRAGRPPASGRDDRRADLGEHRRRTRDRRSAPRLPLHLRHAGQDEPGEDLDAARVRRRGRDHADRRRSALAEATTPSRIASRKIPGGFKPDQYSNPRTPRRTTRRPRRALGADRRRGRRRRRHLRRDGRDDHGVGRYFGARLEGPDRRRRPRGLGLHRGREHPSGPYLVEGIGRSAGPTRSTRPWSTSGCAYRIATRSSRRGDSRGRRSPRRRLHRLHGVGGHTGREEARA